MKIEGNKNERLTRLYLNCKFVFFRSERFVLRRLGKARYSFLLLLEPNPKSDRFSKPVRFCPTAAIPLLSGLVELGKND